MASALADVAPKEQARIASDEMARRLMNLMGAIATCVWNRQIMGSNRKDWRIERMSEPYGQVGERGERVMERSEEQTRAAGFKITKIELSHPKLGQGT